MFNYSVRYYDVLNGFINIYYYVIKGDQILTIHKNEEQILLDNCILF